MLNVIKTTNISLMSDEYLKIFESKAGDFFLALKADWNLIKQKEKVLAAVSAKITQKLIANRDTDVDKLIHFSYTENNSLLSKLLTIAHNYNYKITEPEHLLQEVISNRYYIDELLNNIDYVELGLEELKDVKEENIYDEDAIKDLIARNNELETTLKTLALQFKSATDNKNKTIEELQKKLVESSEVIRELQVELIAMEGKQFETSVDACRKPVVLDESLKNVIPYLVDITDSNMERISIANLTVSVPSKYKNEIVKCIQENPAYLLEFIVTKLPHLIPVIYNHYEL